MRFNSMRILYVENHKGFIQAVKAAFLGHHEITTTPSLAGARRFLNAGVYDVILLDYDLDDGKGIELMRELASQLDHPPVIAVSAYDEKNRQLIENGASAACGKLRFSEIGDVIQSVLRNRAAPNTPRTSGNSWPRIPGS